MSAGNGPNCPVNPRHGRTYSRDRSGDPSKGFRCMHSDHGGNGRGFSEEEITNYQLQETDMSNILESAAREVAAGTTSIDLATSSVAKATKRSAAQVREQLTEAVAILTAQAEARKAETAEIAAAKVAKPVAGPAKGAGSKPRGEHIEPAQFAALRDELGLSNKEVSAVLLASEMGNTLSRVTELTHSKGGSASLFARYTTALNAWRGANPVK